MQMNLKTTLSAYPHLSETILAGYAKKEEVEAVREEIAESYVPEVADRTSDKIYARNGKTREWVELKEMTEASDIDIYVGANDQNQIDDFEEVQGLGMHEAVAKNSKSYNLDYVQEAAGRLWICTSQPVKAIQWMGFLWGDYSLQRDKVVDVATGNQFYCYYSNDILLDNLWSFKLLF